MGVLIDKLLLLLAALGLACMQGEQVHLVESFLLCIVFSSLMEYTDNKRIGNAIKLCFLFSMLLLQGMFWFSPLLLYDIVKDKDKKSGVFFLVIFCFRAYHSTLEGVVMLLLFCAFSGWMQRQSAERIRLFAKLIEMRDNSVELTRLLKNKNKVLLENQEYEIHLATLSERNRIAREIHDNVGHMLSRSILQVGAILAVNQDDTIKEGLHGLKDTLDTAMNSIRKSVHDLHEDSIDLYASIREAADGMKGYETDFSYDVEEDMPKHVKYCILMVVKEALSNVAKHSNATKIWIRVQEHPGFFQCLIEDNGTIETGRKKNVENQGLGMGLGNMKERTEALGGTFLITVQNGFRIFMMIPKESKGAEN